MGKPSQYGRNFGYKYSYFGTDTNGHDVKGYGDTTGKYFLWDASANELDIAGNFKGIGSSASNYFKFDIANDLLYTNGIDIQFKDLDMLVLGTGAGGSGDINITWDGSNLIVNAVADDTLIEIGDSAATQKSFDLKWYANESNGASYLYADASENLLYTVGVDFQFKDNDLLVFGTGAGATGDVNIKWDTSNLVMASVAAASGWNIGAAGNVINVTQHGTFTVGVDDTGYDIKLYGATSGKYLLWDESADALIISGILQLGTTTTAALAMGGGTSGSKLTTAAADKNFGGFWTESTATSGDSRGLYWRHYLGGTIAATGYGDAIRAFCTVTGTGYSYASGIHATMQINAGATVTGSGAGLRATLAAESETRVLVGALAALQIDSDIGANNTVPSDCSMIRLAKAGTVDVPYFLSIADDQCLKGSSATGSPSDALKVLMPDGVTVRYISLIAAS